MHGRDSDKKLCFFLAFGLVVQASSRHRLDNLCFGLLAAAERSPRIPQTKQTGGRFMAFKDVLSLCGRVGLIVAAFAFVAGIVAGPLLERVWSARVTVTQNNDTPLPIPPKVPADPQAGKPG
jgi:hypothetical protein